MSEIRFLSELGDAFDRAIATENVPAPRRARPARASRLNPRWRRRRLLAILAVVLVGGGAATAALVRPNPTTTLAARGLSCISGTNNAAPSDAYNVPQHGESPTVACSSVIGVSASKLVACASHDAGVVVYESDGSADQCESLHLRALPAGYTAANASVNRLERALGRIYSSANCISPAQLVQRAGRALTRLGFAGWRAQLAPARMRGSWSCGAYPASGSSQSDPASALDASSHTVMIVSAPPHSILNAVAAGQTRLLGVSGRHCYSLAAIRREARATIAQLAGTSVRVLFASTRAPRDAVAMQGRQRMYDRGCAIVASIQWTMTAANTLEVQLEDRSSPALSPDGIVPQGAFRSSVSEPRAS